MIIVSLSHNLHISIKEKHIEVIKSMESSVFQLNL